MNLKTQVLARVLIFENLTVEKYGNPHVAEVEYVSPKTKTSKIFLSCQFP